MKVLHYVIICSHLTGDSSVHVYPTAQAAQEHFDNCVQPLLQICRNNEIEIDGDIVTEYNYGQQRRAYRFNSGEHDALDEVIGECNWYYEIGMVNVQDDVTAYVAQFSEWVDESDVTFCTETEAVQKYEELVKECIENAAVYSRYTIDRKDKITWENGEGMTLFSEETNGLSTDAYFGYTDPTFTIRKGSFGSAETKEGLFADMFINPRL